MASEVIRARTLLACREHLLTINRENISPTIGLKLKKQKPQKEPEMSIHIPQISHLAIIVVPLGIKSGAFRSLVRFCFAPLLACMKTMIKKL